MSRMIEQITNPKHLIIGLIARTLIFGWNCMGIPFLHMATKRQKWPICISSCSLGTKQLLKEMLVHL